ncbi:two-component sensor histidine kinase, partial [Ralstonia pseudosolanacearum]
MIAANYQGYHQELSDLRLAFSRSGAVTGVVLVMLGVGLDYGLYPQHQVLFGVARFLVSLMMLTVMLGLPTRWGRPRVQALTLLWLVLPQLMIVWMIWYTDGAESLYYAGLNLAIFAVGIVMPLGFLQTVLFGAFTYIIWVIACVMHAGGIQSRGTFIVHSLFILFSVVASAVYTYFNELGRFQLFQL